MQRKIPREWIRHVRANHAGEYGAMHIYKGAISAANTLHKNRIIAFANEHFAHEESHFLELDRLLKQNEKSKLMLAWKISGFGLGYVSVWIGGEKGFAHTVYHVEGFVQEHLNRQISILNNFQDQEYQELKVIYERIRQDELKHRSDAFEMFPEHDEIGIISKIWKGIIENGSKFAVWIAERI
jgi:ubiquinone biosynthesis monooxygenase Coq7